MRPSIFIVFILVSRLHHWKWIGVFHFSE